MIKENTNKYNSINKKTNISIQEQIKKDKRTKITSRYYKVPWNTIGRLAEKVKF